MIKDFSQFSVAFLIENMQYLAVAHQDLKKKSLHTSSAARELREDYYAMRIALRDKTGGGRFLPKDYRKDVAIGYSIDGTFTNTVMGTVASISPDEFVHVCLDGRPYITKAEPKHVRPRYLNNTL